MKGKVTVANFLARCFLLFTEFGWAVGARGAWHGLFSCFKQATAALKLSIESLAEFGLELEMGLSFKFKKSVDFEAHTFVPFLDPAPNFALASLCGKFSLAKRSPTAMHVPSAKTGGSWLEDIHAELPENPEPRPLPFYVLFPFCPLPLLVTNIHGP